MPICFFVEITVIILCAGRVHEPGIPALANNSDRCWVCFWVFTASTIMGKGIEGCSRPDRNCEDRRALGRNRKFRLCEDCSCRPSGFRWPVNEQDQIRSSPECRESGRQRDPPARVSYWSFQAASRPGRSPGRPENPAPEFLDVPCPAAYPD